MSGSVCQLGLQRKAKVLLLPCMLAIFGGLPNHPHLSGVLRSPQDPTGCSPMDDIVETRLPFIVLATRGGCDFSTKATHASLVGAVGLIVAQNASTFTPLRMESSGTEESILSIVGVMVSKSAGDLLGQEMLGKEISIGIMSISDEEEHSLRVDAANATVAGPYIRLGEYWDRMGYTREARRMHNIAGNLGRNDQEVQEIIAEYYSQRGDATKSMHYHLNAKKLEVENLKLAINKLTKYMNILSEQSARDAIKSMALMKGNIAQDLHHKPMPRASLSAFGLADYLAASDDGIPFIFNRDSVLSNLPWIGRWTAELLVEKCRDPIVQVFDNETTLMKLSHFLRKLKNNKTSTFDRVEDFPVLNLCLSFLQDLSIPFFGAGDLLQYADDENPEQQLWNGWDAASALQNRWPALSIGRKGHTNGVRTSVLKMPTWIAVLQGALDISIFPRSALPLLRGHSDGIWRSAFQDNELLSKNSSQCPAKKWWSGEWWSSRLDAGEMLLLPAGLAYETKNIGEKWTLSIKQSFVDAPNIGNFQKAFTDVITSTSFGSLPQDDLEFGSNARFSLSDKILSIDKFILEISSKLISRPFRARSAPTLLKFSDFARGNGAAAVMEGIPQLGRNDAGNVIVFQDDDDFIDNEVVRDSYALYNIFGAALFRIQIGENLPHQSTLLEKYILRLYKHIILFNSTALQTSKVGEATWKLVSLDSNEGFKYDGKEAPPLAVSILFLPTVRPLGTIAVLSNKSFTSRCQIALIDERPGRYITFPGHLDFKMLQDSEKKRQYANKMRLALVVFWHERTVQASRKPDLTDYVRDKIHGMHKTGDKLLRRDLRALNKLFSPIETSQIKKLEKTTNRVLPRRGPEESDLWLKDEVENCRYVFSRHGCLSWAVMGRWGG